jgi:diguanylate cyclase (GGDEF)-like protein
VRDLSARDSSNKTLTTEWSPPKRPNARAGRDAYLIHIYPSGATLGFRYALAETAAILGRDDDSNICIADPSVSRCHARIERGPDGFQLTDLASTNGTFINDNQVTTAPLRDGDYVRIGNCIYRFLTGDNVEADYHEEIYRLTIIDGLTQIHNKRYLLETLDHELGRSARHHRPLALVMFDIDHFKNVNDQLGHLGGDYTLRELAGMIRRAIRKEDLFARYGGEEFALVLGETIHPEAVETAEKIRALVAAYPLQFDQQSYRVTVSAGVTSTRGDPMLSPLDFIREADTRLYQAKQQGRNRVVA